MSEKSGILRKFLNDQSWLEQTPIFELSTWANVVYICAYICMLNKNSLTVKIVRGQSEAAL